MQDPSEKDIIIVINDNAQDGIDVSWLWDVDFDRFKEDNIHSITVSGIRCQDMRLRMKYVNISSLLEADIETAIRSRIKDGCRKSVRAGKLHGAFWHQKYIKETGGKRIMGDTQKKIVIGTSLSGSSESLRRPGKYPVPEETL